MAMMQNIHTGEIHDHCDCCMAELGKSSSVHGIHPAWAVDKPFRDDLDLCEPCMIRVLVKALGVSKPSLITDPDCCIGCHLHEPGMGQVSSSLFDFPLFGSICDFCTDTMQRHAREERPAEYETRVAELMEPDPEAADQKLADDLDALIHALEEDRRTMERKQGERERQLEYEREHITRTFTGDAMWGFTGYLSQAKALAWQMGLECDTVSQASLLGKATLFRVSGPRSTVNRYLEHLRQYA